MDKSSPEHVLRHTGNLAKALREIIFRENVLTQSNHASVNEAASKGRKSERSWKADVTFSGPLQ